MPLAEIGACVPGSLKRFGDGGFRFWKLPYLRGRAQFVGIRSQTRTGGGHMDFGRSFSRQDSRATRRAHGGGSVGRRKTHAHGGELFDVRSLEVVAFGAGVSGNHFHGSTRPAHVVGVDEYKVRFCGDEGTGDGHRQKQG